MAKVGFFGFFFFWFLKKPKKPKKSKFWFFGYLKKLFLDSIFRFFRSYINNIFLMIFIFFSRHTISNTTISRLFTSLATVSVDFEVLTMFMRFFMLFLLFFYLIVP